MKCEIIKDLLPSYVDGICCKDSIELVEEHLQSCEECTQLLEEMKQEVLSNPKQEFDLKAINPLKKLKQKTRYSIITAILATLFAVILLSLSISVKVIEGNSMSPSFNDGDICIFNKLAYVFDQPNRYDVVLAKIWFGEFSHTDVARVIGLPGETIRISNETLYVDGVIFKDYKDKTVVSGDMDNIEIVIPENCYFLMGDNQAISYDSRYKDYGLIQAVDIYGKSVFRNMD